MIVDVEDLSFNVTFSKELYNGREMVNIEKIELVGFPDVDVHDILKQEVIDKIIDRIYDYEAMKVREKW